MTMFKRKTFNLVNEEEVKKRENLYAPKRCRWMKYIVVPAMIGFILLLVLMNVDFSDKTKTLLLTDQISKNSTLSPMHSEQGERSFILLPNRYARPTGAANCAPIGDDVCTILCSNGNLDVLAGDLGVRQFACKTEISVKLDNCFFPSQKLMDDTFRGVFYVKSLEITNSDLMEIVDGAFGVPSLKNVMFLNMNTTAMTKLTANSFDGLTKLQELKFTNAPGFSQFKGVNFLQPVAKTLQHVSLCQKSDMEAYDPLTWFDGNEKYSNLIHVDLSGNNFANTLSQEVFVNLAAVRELILADCSITELDMSIFDDIIETLEYLDLSSNDLQTLDVSFLTRNTGLRLELHNNAWSCACENFELIKALQDSQFTYVEEPLCLTPAQWRDTPLKEVTLKCDEEPETTQAPTSSTSSSTTIATVNTTSSIETSTPDLEPTPSTAKTTVNTTISTEIASSISTATPNETSSTAESKETDETESTSTKPLLPKPTIPAPVNPIELVCTLFHKTATSTNYTITTRNYDARFTIRSSASNSVDVFVANNMQHLYLIYFTFKNRTYVNTTEHSSAEASSTSYTIIHVEHLYSYQTYIFCLMPSEEHTTSPFNCQSHHIEAVMSKAWLLINDQPWFFIVIIFGIMLSICFGLICVYWLLRWRPTWLRGCKRIIKTDAATHEVYLLPKPQRKCNEQDDSHYHNSNSTGMHPNSSLDIDSHNYMQFYKDLQIANRNRNIHTFSSILSPKEQAPAVPQNQSRTASLQSTIPADDLIEHYESDDGNHYQSIDYYELLS